MSRRHTHLNARRWEAVRRTVFERDGWRCRKCGRAGRLEVDHVVPLKRGGDRWAPPTSSSSLIGGPITWSSPARLRPTWPRSPGTTDDLRFRYRITRDDPPWRPVRVFDDTAKVYIQFPVRLNQGEAPPLFVVGPAGEAELVNYRVRGHTYIVDRLFAAAELRLGEDQQQVVRITRTDEAVGFNLLSLVGVLWCFNRNRSVIVP